MIQTSDGEVPPGEDHRPDDEFPPGFWDDPVDDLDPVRPPPWRRPLLIVVAVVTAASLALVPIYNVFFTPRTADNGLEVCGFDYCVVEDAVRSEGLGDEMSLLFNTILDDEAAVTIAADLVDHLGVEPVSLVVVDDLEGRIGGVYDPATRMIAIERPVRAWTVLHEVAHTLETGHDEDFQNLLIDLTRMAGE